MYLKYIHASYTTSLLNIGVLVKKYFLTEKIAKVEIWLKSFYKNLVKYVEISRIHRVT